MQMLKSTRYFELFLRRNPGTVRVSTENSKDKVILARCAVFGPATAEFRLISPPRFAPQSRPLIGANATVDPRAE